VSSQIRNSTSILISNSSRRCCGYTLLILQISCAALPIWGGLSFWPDLLQSNIPCLLRESLNRISRLLTLVVRKIGQDQSLLPLSSLREAKAWFNFRSLLLNSGLSPASEDNRLRQNSGITEESRQATVASKESTSALTIPSSIVIPTCIFRMSSNIVLTFVSVNSHSPSTALRVQ
jgi:hypothetical protein